MKKIILTCLVCLITMVCISQSFIKKQTLIPLSIASGVPFYKDKELNDLIINGFEVDDKGNFYFFGGDEIACLAVFNGTKQLYRKTYTGFSAGEISIYKNGIYSFSFDNKGTPTFIQLNLTNGLVVKQSHFPLKYFSRKFVDSSIVYTIAGSKADSFYYKQYSITGTYIKNVSGEDGVNTKIFPAKINQAGWELVGKWNNNFIFWNPNPTSSKYEILCLAGNDGKILATKLLPAALSGGGYAENPSDDRKVRNGSFFILGRKGNDALITEIPLQGFFYK